MCVLCGHLVGDLHWSEVSAGEESAGELMRRRERFLRVRAVNRVLRHYGLTCYDDWSATRYVVTSRKGACELVANLGELWPAARRLVGRPLDPLDPALLADLEAK
jgi:hypothetical protein